MTATEIFELGDSLITSAAKTLFSRYRDYVSFEDVEQECWIWWLENQRSVERWRDQYSEKHAERTILKALRRAAERYCRGEKAHKDGYHPEDEFYYTIPMVAELLVAYFDPDWMLPKSTDLASRTGGKSSKSPAEHGDLMAMVADVGQAFEQQSVRDQHLLKDVYGHGVVADNIATHAMEWEVSYSAADGRIRRAVGRVRASLGGANPYGGSDD